MANVFERLQKVIEKNEKPILVGREKLVDKVVKMKNDLEDMKKTYQQIEESLHDEVYKLYDKARKIGKPISSILAIGEKTNGCMVIYSDKFSNLPLDMEKQLKASDPEYHKHFIEIRKLSVKKDIEKTISDEKIIALMKACDAVGIDFDNMFDVKVEIGTTNGIANIFHELPKKVQDILKQAKASTRNVTENGKAY